MDRMEFFRQVTMKICSTFEVEQSLKHCFDMLVQHMPVDVLYLSQYQEDLPAMRFIASARMETCSSMDTILRLPDIDKESITEADEVDAENSIEGVVVFNRSDEMPMSQHILKLLDLPPSSSMSLPLMIADQWIGSLDLFAEGEDRFTDEHIRLFALLREPMALAMANSLKHREIVKLKNLLADDNKYLQKELRKLSGSDIVGSNFGLKHVMQKASQVAALDSPVLILGETGTGKDVIANAIHYSSQRKDGPFVKINCGAIPDTLIDSELFGHEKGAFTGALNQKRGCFERAMNGTVFLDEIGELPAPAQVRLLRVLQDKEIQRVGGEKVISLDVRVLAATNRKLEEMVKNGSFREDLWFRLDVFPISIPALRDRKADIPALLKYFVEKKAADLKLPSIPSITPAAIDAMQGYDWPGNVRELANIVERALILNPQGPLAFAGLGSIPQTGALPVPQRAEEISTLDDVIAGHIRRALTYADGKIHGSGGAAEILGINPNTLRSRMKKLGMMKK